MKAIQRRLQSMITDEAIRWWRMKRPKDWRVSQHIDSPTVNCTSADEQGLAMAVAQYVALVRERTSEEP